MTGSLPNREKEQFHKLDYQIMKHAFDIHNRMGNWHDEEVYQNELLHLLQQNKIYARKEVPLPINFQSFNKTYYLDLLIEEKFIYELKVLAGLSDQCRSQVINYQLISEYPYGKLINFGSSSVEHEFVTSTLSKAERQTFVINQSEWDDATDPDLAILTGAQKLFAEWGTRLAPSLYTEALISILPQGEEARIQIRSDNRCIGTKLIGLVKQGIALKITMSKNPNPLRSQFQKFVNHTNLSALKWINLNKDHITFSTLKKK